ncbi:MAG TPA: PAS domain S-box protein [Chloroflexi bacterium]|nr:PAS domain S-box protein [Chloroflexota bacterium]
MSHTQQKPSIESLQRQLEEIRASLRASEARFHNVVQANADGMLVIDADGTIQFANPAAGDILGRREEDLVGEPFGFPITTALDQPIEIDVVRPDGAKRLVEMRVTETEWAKAPAHLVSLRDVTGHKQTEEALQRALSNIRQREREVSALLEGARAVLAYRDFETTARTIFDICRDLIGAVSGYVALLNEQGDENELLFLEAGGLPCTVDPELPMPIRGLRETAYRTGEAVYHNDFFNSQWFDLMPAGHVRLDNVLFAPLVSEGCAIGLIGLANKPAPFTDADAHIAKAFGDLAAIALLNSRTLESLEESREKFRSVVEQSEDGIVLTDEGGYIIEWNQGAERIFGLPRDTVLGQPLWDVQFRVAPAEKRTLDIRRELETMLRQMFHARSAPRFHQPYDTEIERPDGTRRFVQSVIFPVEIEQRFMVGSVIRDITEQKRAEQRIQAALHEKEVLLKEIHHRVKNNLAIVAGLLDFQAARVEDEQAREAFLESQNRVYTMAHIHEHLYRSDDLARIEMADYLVNLMNHLRQSYGAYGVELAVQADDIALPVDVAIPCGLIVNELVSNALQHAFSPERRKPGPDRVAVELYEREGELTLTVGDNGVGLPPDFDQQNLSSLGLKLTDMLSRQLGGEATHHNEGGAMFTVIWPTPTTREEENG